MSNTARVLNLRVNEGLTGRDIATRLRHLCLKPNELALGAADQVWQPSHHIFTTMNLKDEVSFSPKSSHDLATELTFWLAHGNHAPFQSEFSWVIPSKAIEFQSLDHNLEHQYIPRPILPIDRSAP